MSKKDDYRADMIDFTVAYATETKNNLIIQTSGSTIIGTPIGDEKVNPIFDSMIEEFAKFRSSKLDELEKDEDTFISTRAVFLKDVEILGGNPIKLPFLVVFTDEIAGISFGNRG